MGSASTPEVAAKPQARAKDREAKALRRFHDEDDLERVYDMRMILALWPYVRPHRRYVFAAAALLVVMAVFGMVRPLIMKAALEAFQAPGGAEKLTLYGVILGTVIIGEQALAFPQMYWLQVAGMRAMAGLREEVFSFLHTRSLSFFDRTPIGRLVSRVTNDVDSVSEMFASGALNAIGDLIRLVAIVIIMLSMNWKMSLFAFAVLPVVAVIVNWTRKRMRVAYREVRARTARINAFINEQVSGVDVVQAYAREERTERDFDEINDGQRVANMRAIVLDATQDASIEMVGSLCIAAILWYAGARSLGPAVDFPTLFAFVAYIDLFFMPVRNLSNRYTQIQSALAGAERVFQLLGSSETDAVTEDGVSEDFVPVEGAPAFALKSVTFGYKPETPVLHNVSLSVAPGEMIAVVGPTGSGKTTIASLLLRLYDVTDGVVEVLGRDVSTVAPRALRRQFAVVPQDVFLFPGTIATNIAAGALDLDRNRAQKVLEDIGAASLLATRPEGLDAPVLERGSNLSAGERQLIAFARALYKDPALLILDEPTANIDSETERQLQQAMENAAAGRTTLIIAHRLSTIQAADRIVCLHHGEVAEQGSHDELMQLGGIYARLVRLQAAKEALDTKVQRLAVSESA